MSELEATHFCKKDHKETIHLFSGSGTKGVCMECGNELPEQEKANLKKTVCFNG